MQRDRGGALQDSGTHVRPTSGQRDGMTAARAGGMARCGRREAGGPSCVIALRPPGSPSWRETSGPLSSRFSSPRASNGRPGQATAVANGKRPAWSAAASICGVDSGVKSMRSRGFAADARSQQRRSPSLLMLEGPSPHNASTIPSIEASGGSSGCQHPGLSSVCSRAIGRRSARAPITSSRRGFEARMVSIVRGASRLRARSLG